MLILNNPSQCIKHIYTVSKPAMHISEWKCTVNIVTLFILLMLDQYSHCCSRSCSENYALGSAEYQFVNPEERVCWVRNVSFAIIRHICRVTSVCWGIRKLRSVKELLNWRFLDITKISFQLSGGKNWISFQNYQ